MATKEMIDIEALLYRAYAQYRVDKVTPQSVLGLARMKPAGSLVGAMQAVALGTIVDNSGAAARMIGLQTMAAATPDDLLTVHDHVLALMDWRIEDARGDEPRAWTLAEIDGKGWYAEETASGAWLVRPGEGPKGEDLLAPLTNPYLSVLVIEHARAGTRPEHGEPLAARRGRPNAMAREERADLRMMRAVYAVWHAALATLAADLGKVLLRHHVLPPSAPAEPWCGQAGGAVLAGQGGEGFAEVNSAGHKPLKARDNRRF
ncbi:hypothetical protein ABIE41_003871 [Bosea sp. OAE506]|uniref:hypothetical protein n=1 Tax=Bosea sp. OAE506 TaxID=2663870 RepID=UPI00178B4198